MENRRCVVGIRLNGHNFGSDCFQTILQEFHNERDLKFLSFNRDFKHYLTGTDLIGFSQQFNLPCLISSGLKMIAHHDATYANNIAGLIFVNLGQLGLRKIEGNIGNK